MRKKVQPSKLPTQARSRATVNALVEATARVLVREGFERANTNRIAKEAGVSVGSLYQYFPSKEALVAELARRHSEEVLHVVAERMQALANAPLGRIVEVAIDMLVDAHASDAGVHRVLFEHGSADGMREIEERAIDVTRKLLESRKASIGPTDLDMASFVLVHALETVTHRAPHVIGKDRSDRLKRELRRLVLGYLSPADARGSASGRSRRAQRSRSR